MHILDCLFFFQAGLKFLRFLPVAGALVAPTANLSVAGILLLPFAGGVGRVVVCFLAEGRGTT